MKYGLSARAGSYEYKRRQPTFSQDNALEKLSSLIAIPTSILIESLVLVKRFVRASTGQTFSAVCRSTCHSAASIDGCGNSGITNYTGYGVVITATRPY